MSGVCTEHACVQVFISVYMNVWVYAQNVFGTSIKSVCIKCYFAWNVYSVCIRGVCIECVYTGTVYRVCVYGDCV